MSRIRRDGKSWWRNRSFDFAQFQQRALERTNRAAELMVIALVGLGVIMAAAWLTPFIVNLIRKTPELLTHSFGLFVKACEQPWQHWLAFPFVLAVLGLATWCLVENESGNNGRPVRGRTVLSGDEARRAARQLLGRPETKRREIKK